MKKYLLVIICFFCLTLFLLPFKSYAQMQKMPKGYNLEKFKNDVPKLLSLNNAGKEYWCTFHPCFQTFNLGDKIYIYVSSNVKTTVTLEVPGKGYKIQKETIPNGIISFQLADTIGQPYSRIDMRAPEAERIYNGAGIHVYADQPIIVYGVNRFSYKSESYLALPVSSLGEDYIVASWPDISDSLAFGSILTSYTEVVAAYDNTRVKFTLGGTPETVTAGGQKSGQTTSWTLYKGDVLMFGSLSNYDDLTGSKWIATKPVACFSGNYNAFVPEDKGYANYLIEAELPTDKWGKTYFYTPIAGRLKNSIVRIFAKDSNTSIYRDGQQIGFIKYPGGLKNEGWLSMRADSLVPRPIVFSGDKPIRITQYNTGQTDDSIQSDPFQMTLLPYEHFQYDITFNTPGIKGGIGFVNNWVNIVYRIKDDGTIPDDLMIAQVIDSQLVWKPLNVFSPDSGLPFSIPVNGHYYACKQILLPEEGVYKIKANYPFCAYAYGFNPYCSYGHPAGLSLGDLGRNDTLPPHPQYLLDCVGTYWLDSTNNKVDATVEDWPLTNERSNLSSIYMDPNLSYNYGLTYKEFIPCETASTTWHAFVKDIEKDGRAVITFTDCAGNDSTIELDYNANVRALRPNLDFGNLEKGDTVYKDMWVVNESQQSPNMVDSIKLKYNNQGFQITGVTLPQMIPPIDSIKFQVCFIATKDGDFKDSIGAGGCCPCNDTCPCNIRYKTEVKAHVGIVDVKDNNLQENTLNLFPNPVEDNMTIQFNNEIKSNSTINILDIFGNLIDEIICNTQNINYNTSKMANGLYFVQLNTGKKIVTKTFMIMR